MTPQPQISVGTSLDPKEYNKEFQGYLGMILGSAAAALLHTGYSREDIHDLLDMAFRAHDAAPNNPAMKEAIELIKEASEEIL